MFSRTLGADHTLDALVDQLPKFHAYHKWDDTIIRDIMEYSRLKTERGVLLLLDDMITDTKVFNKRNKKDKDYRIQIRRELSVQES